MMKMLAGWMIGILTVMAQLGDASAATYALESNGGFVSAAESQAKVADARRLLEETVGTIRKKPAPMTTKVDRLPVKIPLAGQLALPPIDVGNRLFGNTIEE